MANLNVSRQTFLRVIDCIWYLPCRCSPSRGLVGDWFYAEGTKQPVDTWFPAPGVVSETVERVFGLLAVDLYIPSFAKRAVCRNAAAPPSHPPSFRVLYISCVI